MRVDVVEIAGLNQRVADGGALAAFLGTEEQIVLSANGNRMHGTFCGDIIRPQKTGFQIRPDLYNTHQGIADRGR